MRCNRQPGVIPNSAVGLFVELLPAYITVPAAFALFALFAVVLIFGSRISDPGFRISRGIWGFGFPANSRLLSLGV